MKKTYYSPAMEETMCQGLKVICDSKSGDEYIDPDANPFGAPRHL